MADNRILENHGILRGVDADGLAIIRRGKRRRLNVATRLARV